jgi:hypothetical protein
MHQIVKIAAVIVLAASLGACQSIRPDTAVVTVDRPTLTVPPVDNLHLKDIDWYVITKSAKSGQPGSVDEAFRKGNSSSLYALSAKDYENISVNTANMLKSIKQYQSQVRAYQQYYDVVDPKKEGKDDGSKKTTSK